MNNLDHTKISHRIRELRRAHDMTQTKLAILLDIHQTSLSNLESGRNAPTLEMLIKLCNIFKVRMDYFISDYYTFDLKRDALNDKAKLRAITEILNAPTHPYRRNY